ncbi:MAG: cytochrome c [Gammaproteobacteria bacterium]|nr:cytochrome c [Gammaproteobacteria bacterium]
MTIFMACAVAEAAPGRADEDAAARFDYLLHCSGCHRTDGRGSAPDVPSLRGPVGSLVGTPEGREYIARVPEVAQSPLDDEDLARLLNWVLREFNAKTLPPRFRPLDGDEVGAARARILTDPLRARAAINSTYAPKAPAAEEESEPFLRGVE